MKILSSNIAYRANKMSKLQAKYINDTLLNSKNIDIVCHDSTDRDSAYSALAMQAYLNKQGINSRIILSQDLKALGINQAQDIIQSCEIDKIENVTPDTVLCVDFSKDDRISSDVLNHIRKSKNIVGFDHHSDLNIVDSDYVFLTDELENSCPEIGKYYVDTTSKSATSVIYRFFEALNEEIDTDTAKKLFKGMADDCTKRGLIKCDGLYGTIEPQKAFKKDKNAYEVYNKLREKLNKREIEEVTKEVDILASLTDEQQQFKDSLQDRMVVCKNQKTAYVEIPPDDEQWQKLGGDNPATSAILNRFRQETLNNNENLNTVVVFYEAQGNYRLSLHSKNHSLLGFYKDATNNLKKYEGFSVGGHPQRGGGKICTIDKETCASFVQDILSYLE